ncbi:MAG: RHS repeat-associated core domain-containing protein, partial [Bacteroidota bacterium]|nr:RHS repeat-associated core domain-containing protein [Bacteroidota bacterium]
GQLKQKKVGDGLQTVDYTYNVRGWLKQINNPSSLGSDLFAFGINYNTVSHSGTALYNGNISETEWRTANTDNALKWYRYGYDPLNRITSATASSANYHLSSVSYDKNGNILALNRKGHTNSGATTFGTMDDLVYTYDSGNKLTKVLDNGNDDYGFKDLVNQTTEYTYDANGNMLTDANKGITGITYNHLNLPTAITTAQGTISYIYDAAGTKLQKTVGSAVTQYAGNYIYQDGNLEFFSHPEGYVYPDGNGGYDYVYQYKDHLGNIRLSYTDGNGNGTVESAEIVEENNYYPFGLKHKGYNNVTSSYGNSVANKWKFGGKEYEDDLGKNTVAYEWRDYDPAIGRFGKIDRFAEKYGSLSPYAFTKNNPMRYREMAGDSIWVTSTTSDDGKTNWTIHVTGKVLNTSDTDVDVDSYAKSLSMMLGLALTGENENFSFSADVQITGVESIDDVDSSDHLIALVDNVEGKSAKGGDAGGLAKFGGQIAYVETKGNWYQKNASFPWMVAAGVHELGHNFGLLHNWEDNFDDSNSPNNYMGYSGNFGSFSTSQLNKIIGGYNAGDLNKGNPTQRATGSSYNLLWHTSTNTEPYDFNVKKGDIIPTILNN